MTNKSLNSQHPLGEGREGKRNVEMDTKGKGDDLLLEVGLAGSDSGVPLEVVRRTSCGAKRFTYFILVFLPTSRSTSAHTHTHTHL